MTKNRDVPYLERGVGEVLRYWPVVGLFAILVMAFVGGDEKAAVYMTFTWVVFLAFGLLFGVFCAWKGDGMGLELWLFSTIFLGYLVGLGWSGKRQPVQVRRVVIPVGVLVSVVAWLIAGWLYRKLLPEEKWFSGD